jgi:tetraacyldisaccharide 4'-kinase
MGAYLNSLNIVSLLLLPFSAVYWVLHQFHKLLYVIGILRTQRLAVPVIVVGNITVGGTGKTPLVTWLCACLESNGFRPGIISRGYKGRTTAPNRVQADSDSKKYGDEPVLLARETGVPVYTSSNRVEAAKRLLAENQCDVLISDDGLQHYRLGRDIEIAVIDGWRRFGNGWLLPAGPLRESKRRLSKVDWVLCRGGEPQEGELPYKYVADGLQNLKTGEEYGIGQFKGKQVHAVAGIGNPDQFFNDLVESGLNIYRHPFPDHYEFQKEDLQFPDNLPIIMTEKDAVKCGKLVGQLERDVWYLAIKAQLPESFGKDVVTKLNEVTRRG